MEEANMHNLGRTRSSQQTNHLLLTPDTFVRTTFPGMKGCSAVVHAGPAMGACVERAFRVADEVENYLNGVA